MKCVLVDRNSICEKNICKIKNLYEIHNVLLNDIGQYNTELFRLDDGIINSISEKTKL